MTRRRSRSSTSRTWSSARCCSKPRSSKRRERSLDRVRLEGPFSNQALLRAGWADATAEKFDRALVPWSILSEREPTDAAVQEAGWPCPTRTASWACTGARPFCTASALENFEEELEQARRFAWSIEDAALPEGARREEIRQDKDWVIRLRSLPDAPETFYLATLMASHEFQTGLQNDLDLKDRRKKLARQGSPLRSKPIRRRREDHQPLLPDRCAVPQARLTDQGAPRAARPPRRAPADTPTAPRPDDLATADEQRARRRPTGDRVAKRERADRTVCRAGSIAGRRADRQPREELPRAARRGRQASATSRMPTRRC